MNEITTLFATLFRCRATNHAALTLHDISCSATKQCMKIDSFNIYFHISCINDLRRARPFTSVTMMGV